MAEEKKTRISTKEIINQVERLQSQMRELSEGSKVANDLVRGLIEAFKPDDDSPRAFEDLIEFLTWLYVEDFKGTKLAGEFRRVTSAKKVNADSLHRFIDLCVPRIHARHRKEEVSHILEHASENMKDFIVNREATFKDPEKLSKMVQAMDDILKKHRSFSSNSVDRARRAAFACYIILHEKTACTLLTEYVSKNGLDKSDAYAGALTRKREELRITLQDVSSLDMATMCDRL